jgi:hypothetical protein
MSYLFQTNTIHRATTTTGSLVVQEGWGPGATGQQVWEQAGGGGLHAASHGGRLCAAVIFVRHCIAVFVSCCVAACHEL